MKKTPRFLLCQNPLIEEKHLFILSTRRGELLMKVIDNPDKTFSLEIEKIYSATEDEVRYALHDATKWYIGARHY
jgi:hypothetical protein